MRTRRKSIRHDSQQHIDKADKEARAWKQTTEIATTQLKQNHKVLMLPVSLHQMTNIFRLFGILDLEKPPLLQAYYTSQLKRSLLKTKNIVFAN